MMKKKWMTAFFAILFVLGLSLTASAADYPKEPVQLLIPFGAGGSADFLGRALANAAEKYLGQPIVPVNRPGAGGGIMYNALKNSKPNGYTLGWCSTGILTVTDIGNVPFKWDAFDYACRIGYSGLPIAVRADAPWKTFKEFVDYVKKNPGKVKIGNAGTGSATHVAAIVIEKDLGLQMIHVPLGAERRIPSLLGGEMDAICVPLPEIAAQVQAGKARLLVIPSENRDPDYPNVPTCKELGYNIVIDLWRGISTPKGTPDNVLKKIEEAFKKGTEDPKFREISKKNSFIISFMDRPQFEKYVKEQDVIMAKVMEEAGLKKK